MRALVLACGLVIMAGPWASAGYIVEGAFSSAARFSTNFNAQSGTPGETGPTYTLITSGNLPAYKDVRGAGSFGDASLKFALSSVVPAGQSIVAATLTLNAARIVSSLNGQAPSLVVTGFAADTNPIAFTDFDRPGMALGSMPVIATVGSSLAGGANPLIYDVTRFLQSLQANGSTSAGFRLDNPTSGIVLISSVGDPIAANQPSLTITYAATVPEPMSALLAALGLVIALGAARRRRLILAGLAA